MLKKCSFFTKSEKDIKLKTYLFTMDLSVINLNLIISSVFSAIIVLSGTFILYYVTKNKISNHVNEFTDSIMQGFGLSSSSSIARQRGLKSGAKRQSQMISKEILDNMWDGIEKQFPIIGIGEMVAGALGFEVEAMKTLRKMSKKNPEATLAFMQQNPDLIRGFFSQLKSGMGQAGQIPAGDAQPQDFISSLLGGLNPVAKSVSQLQQPAFNAGIASLTSSKKPVSVK